ncbi:MAG: cupin domain-containing protein [Pseudomonadota bacterium]
MSDKKSTAESLVASGDSRPEIKHLDDMDWEMNRFGLQCKFPFHPNPERPTEPNAGVIKFEPGSGFVLHRHDFAQVWYVIEGECRYGDDTLRAGSVVFHPDPHFEHELYTENGCSIVFLQYPGPTTGGKPLYDGRMNLEKAEKPEEFDLRV